MTLIDTISNQAIAAIILWLIGIFSLSVAFVSISEWVTKNKNK